VNLTRKFLIVLCLSVSTLTGAQTVYHSKDAQGNPVFSDQPKPGAKAVEVKPTNTTPALTPTYTPPPTSNQFKAYSHIGIAVPSPIPNGLVPTNVGILVEPALQPGHSWQLKLDGGAIASGTEAGATIPPLERGNHVLQIDVLDGGRVVGSSDPVDVFVLLPGSGGGNNILKPTPH
jgi:hypothetical protein